MAAILQTDRSTRVTVAGNYREPHDKRRWESRERVGWAGGGGCRREKSARTKTFVACTSKGRRVLMINTEGRDQRLLHWSWGAEEHCIMGYFPIDFILLPFFSTPRWGRCQITARPFGTPRERNVFSHHNVLCRWFSYTDKTFADNYSVHQIPLPFHFCRCNVTLFCQSPSASHYDTQNTQKYQK